MTKRAPLNRPCTTHTLTHIHARTHIQNERFTHVSFSFICIIHKYWIFLFRYELRFIIHSPTEWFGNGDADNDNKPKNKHCLFSFCICDSSNHEQNNLFFCCRIFPKRKKMKSEKWISNEWERNRGRSLCMTGLESI